jgi:RND family efflux transporter MFP subunit
VALEEIQQKGPKLDEPGRFFYLGWTVAVILGLVATGGLVLARERWIGRQTSQLAQRLAQGRRVLVARALSAPAERQLELPASVHGYIETPVYAKISGYLKAIRVDKGDRVKKDQVLAVLESPELDKQVADAKANYWIEQVTDNRNQQLVREGVVPQQTADVSHAQMLQALATFEQLKAMQAYKIVTAPFAGIVTARYVDPGTLIPQVTAPANGATPIVALATLSPLRIYTQAPQSAAPFLHDGDAAVVAVSEYPGREFTGTVTRHPKALDSSTRTMLVEVDLPNRDQALYPGMYATVKLAVKTPRRPPLVPDDALVFRAGAPYVAVVRNNVLRVVPVELGYDDGRTVEVSRGIEPGELVALNVGQAARDGEQVRPVMLANR